MVVKGMRGFGEGRKRDDEAEGGRAEAKQLMAVMQSAVSGSCVDGEGRVGSGRGWARTVLQASFVIN